MNINDFNYDLPEELIAQTPLQDRSSSKLLVMDKKTGVLKHETFKNITNYLHKGDVLVLNDTKVIPARLIGTKEETGAVIEILLLKAIDKNIWECLSKPAKRLKEGTIITFGNGLLKARVNKKLAEGIVHIELIYEGILMEILEKLGTMPLPPYIHKKLEDQSRYQTVYAKNIGSAAAPTAGLHFTKELLNEIEKKGVIITYVTLHVGLGTFRPVEVEDIKDHHMHSEYYVMNEETANILNKAKEENRRIIAVGTTSTRTLETIATNHNGKFIPVSGTTDIFIYPGYEFKAIDCLITNFHLPKSTLVMLVSALSTKENILKAYQEAINNNYRFFSFGDAMFITNDINSKQKYR
ncbi:MAG TPA: tRNA preQ1(34) S-adenosylmethionine ribosyltransferase-isomerase QueA [Firmicutes bacterium]|nr:tRNA preQ1(34) S-adenosylmethionine ribosyltransferase-isomerase QueA [Bacillota bacterium]